MTTFENVLIGFKAGKAYRREGWEDKNRKLEERIDLYYLWPDDILAEDWYEVPTV